MQADFVIIGAGVIGLSTAYELALQGLSVTVIERGDAGGESSWAGSGILSVLPPWEYGAPLNALTQWSLELYPDWVERIRAESGLDPEYYVDGMLVMRQHDPKYDAARAHEWCRRHGVRMEQVSLRDIVPHAGVESEAIWLPQVAQARNPCLLRALRCAAERQGVRIVEQAEVTAFETQADQVTCVRSTRGRHAAGGYIVTAGAWSRAMLGDLALELQIKPIRGQIQLFKANPGLLGCVIRQNGIYLVPRHDGHILVGSTLEDVGFDKNTTAEAQALFIERATEILPQLKEADLVRQWSGLRPGSPDNIPTIDRHPRLGNLYINSGHFRYGLTMAPASARLLGNILARREQPIDVSPYRWPQGSRTGG
jgi:glycine oxidase